MASAPSAPTRQYLTTQDLDLVRQSLVARMAVADAPLQVQQQQQKTQAKKLKGEWQGGELRCSIAGQRANMMQVPSNKGGRFVL